MFLIYFPAEKIASEKPKVFQVRQYENKTINYQTKRINDSFHNLSQKEQTERRELVRKGLVLEDTSPGALILGGSFVPLETGVVHIGSYDKGQQIGINVERGTTEIFNDALVPEEFSTSLYWTKPENISDIVLTLLARASGLFALEHININTFASIRFKSPVDAILKDHGDLMDGDGDFPFEGRMGKVEDDCGKTNGYGLCNGKWFKISKGNVIDIKTGKVEEKPYKRNDFVITLVEDYNQVNRYRGAFNFSGRTRAPYESQSAMHSIFVNLPFGVDDPKAGSKFYELLGITPDYYDEVKYTEEGFVDPSIFLSGKTPFGVIKTSAWIVDYEVLKTFLPEPTQEEAPKGRFFGKSITNEVYQAQQLHQCVSNYIVLNHPEVLPEKVKRELVHGLYLRNVLINAQSYRSKDDEDQVDEFSYMGCHDDKFADKVVDILDSILVKVDVEIPIITPRFDGIVAERAAAAHYKCVPSTGLSPMTLDERAVIKIMKDDYHRNGFPF